MPRTKPPQLRRPDRGQATPPALFAQGEPFDGHNLVTEWRGPEAVPVWQALRDAVLWAGRGRVPTPTVVVEPGLLFRETAPEGRERALAQVAVPDDLYAPLKVLSRVLDPAPAVTVDELARACRAISGWAESNGLPRTAISFTEGAARIDPNSPEHAYQVGLLCRRAAEYVRAETWYRRAIRLAVRAKERRFAALAWSGLGNIFIQRGEFASARFAHMRAYRIARRGAFWDVKAYALHDLFTIAVDTGQVAEAESLARLAFRAYPSTSDRLPVLASDVASHWMDQGFYQRAIIVFQAVLPKLRVKSERLLALSVIARAAAGDRNVSLFTWAWTEAWAILDCEPSTDRACAALYNLAYASACLEDWERAVLAGRNSMALSQDRGETEVHNRAVKLVHDVERRAFKHSLRPRPEEPQIQERAETLARRFVRRLGARLGPSRPASPRPSYQSRS